MNNRRSILRIRIGVFLSLYLFACLLFAQEDIVALEYYVDTDPGVGNATAVTITAGQTINESFTVNTSSLSAGYHILGIRTRNAQNRWSMYERRLFLIQNTTNSLNFPEVAADIQAAEYYIDTDPGVGNGTPIATTGGASITENITINTSSLSTGYHLLGVRVQNNQGRWSMYERRLFLIQDPSSNLNFPQAVADIQAAEYFIDTDPGAGNGTPITTTGGASITESITINTSSLSTGYHLLGVRVQNNEGRWSMHERRLFLIQDPSSDLDFPKSASDILAAEYFIDTDPGLGNGTSITTTGGASISESVTIATSSLSTGYHLLGVRSQNQEGKWSMYERRLFLIQDPNDNLNFPRSSSDIVAAEYYINTDPGVGNGTPITTVGGNSISENFTITTDGLDPGYHILGIRSQNAEGRWSMHERRLFLVQDPEDNLGFPAAPSPIVEMEYFIDEDPGPGNGITVPIDMPINVVDITNLMASVNPDLEPGMHRFSIRAKNQNGKWGFTETAEFELTDTPISGITEADSLALVTFYTDLNGASWANNENWLAADQRIINWFGVGLNAEETQVTEIRLPSNALSGTIPMEIDQLNDLETLDLSDNDIDGLATDLTALTSATTINLSGNKLDFADLESVAGVPGLDYSNQQNIDIIDQGDLAIRVGTGQEITTTANGAQNLYQWTLNGNAIADANAANYTISNMDIGQIGDYAVTVTNSVVTGLALNSETIQVQGTAVVSTNVVDNNIPITENVNGFLFPIRQDLVAPEDVPDTVRFGNSSGLRDVASTFDFPEVLLGDYLVGVETTVPLDDPTLRFVPTYFGDVIYSNEADTLRLTGDTEIQIAMVPAPDEVQGEGVVSGTIDEDFGDEEARVDARRRAKKRKCGLRRRRTGGRTGQDNSEFELIAYGETNDNGEFEFGFLPEGTYRFFVEYPGIPLDESAFVEFTIGEAGVSDTEFVLAVFATPEGVTIEIVLGITTDYFVDFNLYPNPTSDILYIEYKEIKLQDVLMEIIDLNGKVLFTKRMDRNKRMLMYDTSLLGPGNYFVRFTGDAKREPLVYKLIKK